MSKSINGSFAQSAQIKGLGKHAVFLVDPDTDLKITDQIAGILKKYDFKTEILRATTENQLKAVRKIQTGKREDTVCYIAGSSIGDDPELIEKVRALIRSVTAAGYNTVCPGAEGMMGVIGEEVRKAGKPITSIYSMDVAQGFVEQLHPDKFDRIVIAPNEKIRQKLYHLLSGAQIALPGGTGTMTEASVHFYQNTQMGIIYRRLDSFGPDNFPSPIIYYSPSTPKVEAAYKKIICDRFFAGDPMLKKLMDDRKMDVGYWDFIGAAYDNLAENKFTKEKFLDFVQVLRSPELVVQQLDDWHDPKVRELMILHNNVHMGKTEDRFRRITGEQLKPL